LITPFIAFANYNSYSYTSPELWICIGGLTAIGLLCGAIMTVGGPWLRVLVTVGLVILFIDLQFDILDHRPWRLVPLVGVCILLLGWLAREHLSRITTPVFATILASTLVLAGLERAAPPRPESRPEVVPASTMPTVIHILLDEHIGIEGIPSDLQHGPEIKAMLKSFFRSHGFRLFGRAYSRYAHTQNSIPNTLNYTSEPVNHEKLKINQAAPLESNKYFEDMHRAGYSIQTFQTSWIELCKSSERIEAACHTEGHAGVERLEKLNISTSNKAILLYQLYGNLSVINRMLDYFNTRAGALAARAGWRWPDYWSHGVTMPAVAAMHTLSLLSEEVARSRPGQLFFAHLLIPHAPYVYDASCHPREPADWQSEADEKPWPPNTSQSRAQRYALLFEQVQCLYKKLGEMFERWQQAGVFDRAIIILHGDHGSRIFLHRPDAANIGAMASSDYADAFSTLLAIKAPGYEPGYDLRWIAIQDFLPQLAIRGGPGPKQGEPARLPSSSEQRPYVFLKRDGPGPMLRQPLPSFGNAELVVDQRGVQ
jgi:hypothetical protein